jgi:hypothetical protein
VTLRQKAAADHLFGRLGEALGERIRGLESVRLEERMRLLIHAFLEAQARGIADPEAVRAYAELVVRALLPGAVSGAASPEVDAPPTRPGVPQEARRGAPEAAASRRRGARFHRER